MSSPSISQRAIGAKDMPENERPLSERFRIAGDEWVAAKFKRDKIKGLKNTMLERMKRDLIEEAEQERREGLRQKSLTNAEAERIVEMGTEWETYIIGLAEAERDTESAWVRCQEIEMLFGEWQSKEANARKERQMGRQTP